MIKQIDKIFESPLFKGIKKEKYYAVLEALDSQLKNYSKNQYIFKSGKKITRAAILIEGNVSLTRTNFWDEETIVDDINPGELFALTLASNNSISSNINAISTEPSIVLWFNVQDIFLIENKDLSIIAKNLLSILAKQNNNLQMQIWNIKQKKTKDKILSYLSNQASIHNSNKFDIPYNRQELAQHLCVDRAAMSTEFNKLQKEKYFEVNKNHFILLKK